MYRSLSRVFVLQARLGVLTCLLASSFASYAAVAAKPISFQHDIRPILAENCFHCHGPDATTRMAGLRLDLKDAVFQTRKNGPAVTPGKPEASLLYQRVVTAEAGRRMPPPSSHRTLNEQQIGVLKQWIEQSAPWQEHWAFKAPERAPLPAVRNGLWARGAIDRFVMAKLEAAGLSPAPEASRRTLIRRVALDTTGLPPNPAEIEQFVSDTRPAAYERMVDRYLASPHYGEHRARYWLDAARYGDTHGIHVDNFREIWPYRDWVIEAFNRNMPFDQFSIEQLAGDLLPNPTLAQRIATGFHRCNVTTNEAGIIEDEYAEIYAKDRADTTAAVWMGLTVGCATCHDHKFDPIQQKDFYALGAFFRNTSQKVMDDNIPDTPPVLVVPRPTDREAWQKVSAQIKILRGELDASAKVAEVPFTAWLGKRDKSPVAHPFEASNESYTADIPRLGGSAGPYKLGESDIPGRPAIHFEKNEGLNVAEAPRLDADKPFSISVNFFFPKAEQSYTIAAHQNTKDKNRGWVLDVSSRVAAMRLIGDGGQSIEIRAGHLEQLKHGTWNSVSVAYDGSRHQSGLSLYLNGRPIQTQGGGNQNVDLSGEIAVDSPLVLGRSLEGGAIADLRIYKRVISESEAKLLHDWPRISAALVKDTASLSEADRNALLTWYLVHEDKAYGSLVEQQKKLSVDAKAIARRGAVTLVMHEKADTTPSAHLLFRGAYDQKRAEVRANTPVVLPPMRSDQPHNRLGFARWLFTDDQPLTARVVVNRMWQEIFGTGIVKTADDFGSQGEAPSHPELLDWLAVEFRENHWDVKGFYRQLLLSSTYKQQAIATPAKAAKDPENRLLSRGPRFRLDGEAIRDYALAASGLLVRQIGGPSVKPYQPEGVWEAVAMIGSNTRFYKRDSGDGLYRRSMYTFWKRSAPPASLDIFNAPTRESCTVRRERTNTPLQALVTMNDVQFVEAARILAERSMQSTPSFDGQLDFITTQLLARPLLPSERSVARRSFDDFRRHYVDSPDDADKLLNTGERKPNPALASPDFAAMTVLVNELMNLDEVLNK